jgi:DNA polymerase I-like protein with 3'-5' exonuclease and polymerase domains
MLESTYKPDFKYTTGNFSLRLPICGNWNENKNRLLVVLETVDSKDLAEKKLLSERSQTVLLNVIKHARAAARLEREDKPLPSFAYAAVNFNNGRTFDLAKDQRDGHNQLFGKRVRSVIAQLKPTHVLICGDTAIKNIFPSVENSQWKRGWVHTFKIKGDPFLVTNTLDLEPLYSNRQNKDIDEDDEYDLNRDLFGKSNLLGYVLRHTTNLLVGKHCYSLRHIVPHPVYIGTVERFDKMMDKIEAAPIVAIDTETKNLSVTQNKIYILQFAITSEKGYVLPLNHPKTPFTGKQLSYIKKRLRRFFAKRPSEDFKYLVGMNAAFDLRILRYALNIPLIFYPVWDVVAGEHTIDENGKYLIDFGTPSGGLRAIFTSYDNDWYWTAPVSKEERGSIGFMDPSDRNVQNYCAMDVMSIIGIQEKQLERASKLKLDDKIYKPYYRRFVSDQMSDTVHVISHMESRGTALDKLYLTYLKSNDSPLLELINKAKADLYALPAVKKANKLLLADYGSQEGKGLFGKSQWVFNIGKPAHKAILFWDVMDLEPISYTRKKAPQTNKLFTKAYKNKYQEVALFERVTKLSHLWSAYVKGWYNRLKTSPDSSIDNRLRPRYGWFKVVTGRLQSQDPSLQQVPKKDEQAKHIKRTFLAPKGTIHIKFDYSAHEVRIWAIIAKDAVLANLFKIGQSLRKKYRVTPTAELAKQIAVDGDIHIQNVRFFFNMIVEKIHPLREAIKAVVFGVIYKKGAATLARDIKPVYLDYTKKKISILDLQIEKEPTKELEKEKEKLEEELEKLNKRDWKEYAQSLISKLFDRFKVGSAWLDWAQEHAKKYGYVYSPLGRRRNLYGVLTGIQGIVAAMTRRGVNAPIQGMASEVGVKASRLVALNFYEYLEKWCDPSILHAPELPAQVEKMIHDAVHAECPYEHVVPFIHILQWTATYGVAQAYKEKYKFEFIVEPEIELEFDASEDRSYKWDWSDQNLFRCINSVLDDQVALNVLEEKDRSKALDLILTPLKNKKLVEWLNTRYPILNCKENPGLTNLLTVNKNYHADSTKA